MERTRRRSRGAPGERDLLVGAHMSIAGGIDLAPRRGAEVGCRVIQVFTKSSNQWRARPLTAGEAERFRAALQRAGIPLAVAHDSYLINLAASNPVLHRKSIESFLVEMRRCEALGIPYLVAHPGAHGGAGVEEGIRRVAESLNVILDASRRMPVMALLETTAGQGTSVGSRFEEIAAIVGRLDSPERAGVCLDTCHVFAAGYDIRTEEGYQRTLEEFDRVLGLGRLRCIHVNDSLKGLGSRVDRHQHLGRGAIGLVAFRCLVTDPRLAGVPLILETPKGEDLRDDRRNLAILRRLSRAPL